MKSRNAFPPHGWRYINPVFGMKKDDEGSFAAISQKEYARRKANKYLCEKHNLGVDMASVEFDVEQQNVARCIAHGWNDFVESEAPATNYASQDSKKNSRFGNAVGASKRVAAGVGVLLEWLGSSAKPVDQAVAEHRANVCATCPKNDGGDWKAYFTGKVADKIKTQLEIRNDLSLRTSQDEKLTVCSACDCPLKLKIWVGLDYIWGHTSSDVYKRLHPNCWIITEASKAGKTPPSSS
jgi:hypothetical protein